MHLNPGHGKRASSAALRHRQTSRKEGGGGSRGVTNKFRRWPWTASHLSVALPPGISKEPPALTRASQNRATLRFAKKSGPGVQLRTRHDYGGESPAQWQTVHKVGFFRRRRLFQHTSPCAAALLN